MFCEMMAGCRRRSSRTSSTSRRGRGAAGRPGTDGSHRRVRSRPRGPALEGLIAQHEEHSALADARSSGYVTNGAVDEPIDILPEPVEQRRVEIEVGRNDPCWCGSGKKFKRCHGAV